MKLNSELKSPQCQFECLWPGSRNKNHIFAFGKFCVSAANEKGIVNGVNNNNKPKTSAYIYSIRFEENQKETNEKVKKEKKIHSKTNNK